MARRTNDTGVSSGRVGMSAGLSAIYGSLQLVRSIKIMLPLLLYFLFKLSVIILYAKGGPGALDGFWTLFLPGRGAASVGHYPQRFLLLPSIMGRLDIALDILLHVVVQGVTILLIASSISGNPLDVAGSFGRAMKRYGHMIGVMIAATTLILAATYLPELLLRLEWTTGNRYVSTGGGIVLGLAAQALFLFAVPFALLNGRSFHRAIADSFRFARRHYTLSLTLAAVPFIVTLPTFLLGFKVQAISLRLFPELTMHIQILGEIMKMISTYMLIGGVTLSTSRRTHPARAATTGNPSTKRKVDDEIADHPDRFMPVHHWRD